jgi:site-specific DNA recombinase
VIVVDEVSRMARGRRELSGIQDRVEGTGVRLITADGLDTRTVGWELTFGINSLFATHAMKELAHRVERGMRGALDRGHQIGYPPFGLSLQRVHDDQGKHLHSVWVIDETKVPIVREMFEMRRNGSALNAIAQDLNNRGIRTSRTRRTGGTYWRPGTVLQILRNAIYRGLFVWNGSEGTRCKARKKGVPVETVAYERPELRIVSDEVWYDANRRGKTWARGGGKSAFTGLLRCGVCDARLTVASKASSQQVYCAQCAQAVRVAQRADHVGYIGIPVVETALRFAFESVILSEDTLAKFRDRLQARLTANPTSQLEVLKLKREEFRRVRDRLLELVKTISEDEAPDVMAEFRRANATLNEATTAVENAKARSGTANEGALRLQMAADPGALLPLLFAVGIAPEKLSALLSRVFTRIVFLGKLKRAGGIFEIQLAPGVVIAEVTKTAVLDTEVVKLWVQVDQATFEPTTWRATLITVLPESYRRSGKNRMVMAPAEDECQLRDRPIAT